MSGMLTDTFTNTTKCIFAAIPVDQLLSNRYISICGAIFTKIGKYFYSYKLCTPKDDGTMISDQYTDCNYSLNFEEYNAEGHKFTISDGSDNMLTTLLTNLIKNGHQCTIEKCNDITNSTLEYLTSTTELTSETPEYTGSESYNTVSDTSGSYNNLINQTISGIVNSTLEYLTSTTEPTSETLVYTDNAVTDTSVNYTLVNRTINELNENINSGLVIGIAAIGGAITCLALVGTIYNIYKYIETSSDYNNKIAQEEFIYIRSNSCVNCNYQHDNYEDNISFSIISKSEEDSICTGDTHTITV